MAMATRGTRPALDARVETSLRAQQSGIRAFQAMPSLAQLRALKALGLH
jgi:hypothetical protein